MKAFTAFVLISLVTLSTTAAAACYQKLNLTRGENITLTGAGLNNTWSVYHHDGQKNGWQPVCSWNDGRYVCKGDSNTITNLTVVANANLTSRKFQSYSYTNDDGYEKTKLCIYEVLIIELPTTRAPTTVRTTRETTTQPTTRETTQPTTVPTTHPTTTASTTVETTTHTTQLDTKVQNSTVLVRFLLREESTTEQTEATSSAFSSTANLTSLASVNETVIALKLDQDRGLDMQITFLIVCGIFILAVLLYYVFCKARSKSHRTIYRPVIGDPQPLQVEGGLRNLLFSFSVW